MKPECGLFKQWLRLAFVETMRASLSVATKLDPVGSNFVARFPLVYFSQGRITPSAGPSRSLREDAKAGRRGVRG